MAVPLEKFVQQLEDSGIIAGDTLKDFLPPKSEPKDAEELARELVRQKKLTKFQAEEVSKGKGKSLTLGNYVLMEKIGAGGMGQVFKAEHRRMKRVVAVKLLPAAMTKDTAAIARFEREVQAAAKLRHPNIIAADDADQANGVHFLVMELVDGSDLAALVKKNGPFPVNKAVNYISQAAKGLEFAHAEGVVHRDIKPANLLLDKKGTVKILDMGLARIHGDVGQAELTSTGAVMGTVDYMAPEQALNTKTADARADIYALGCSLYYLLTGTATYDGDTLMAKLLAHRDQPIPNLCQACPQVPEPLEFVFRKMMAKKVEDRYQTMTPVIADLSRVIADMSGADNPVPPVEGSDAGVTQAFQQLTSTLAIRPDAGTRSVAAATTTSDAAITAASRKPKLRLSRYGSLAGGALAFLGLPVVLWHILAGGARVAAIAPPIAKAPFTTTQAHAYQQAWAKHLGMNVESTNSAGINFVLIPPGEFEMGSTPQEIETVKQAAKANQGDALHFTGHFDSEAPRHSVCITRPFLISKTEVTASVYEKFLVATGKPLPNELATGGEDDLPAGNISWSDAIEFCQWLGKADGQRYRLPTEAEWEYACRAGTTTAFAFGDGLDSSLANFDGSFPFGTTKIGPNEFKPTKVANYQPNAFGLFDMHGNQWEWCQDFFAIDYYKTLARDDPQGPPTGANHVLRGGDWEKSQALACRSAMRYDYASPYMSIGLRVVREIDVSLDR